MTTRLSMERICRIWKMRREHVLSSDLFKAYILIAEELPEVLEALEASYAEEALAGEEKK